MTVCGPVIAQSIGAITKRGTKTTRNHMSASFGNFLSQLSRPLHRRAMCTAAAVSTPARAVKSNQAVAIDLFDSIDVDKSGTIEKSEYEAVIDKMNSDEIRQFAKQSFNTIDQDGSGTITRSQFISAFNDEAQEPAAVSIADRFKTTAEVVVSKIFPAGAGWQAGSLVAGAQGFADTDMGFFALCGLGDGLGVLAGHSLYMAVKGALGGQTSGLSKEIQVGTWLGSAAVCSGTAWQPVVNALHGNLGCDFIGTLGLTGAATGLVFFAGLRVGRVLYSPFMSGILPGSYDNLKADAGLSVSIGAATGTFVGTDVSFEDANFLRPFFGVEDFDPDHIGVIKAGASTAAGFSVMQTGQNLVMPAGRNWVD